MIAKHHCPQDFTSFCRVTEDASLWDAQGLPPRRADILCERFALKLSVSWTSSPYLKGQYAARSSRGVRSALIGAQESQVIDLTLLSPSCQGHSRACVLCSNGTAGEDAPSPPPDLWAIDLKSARQSQTRPEKAHCSAGTASQCSANGLEQTLRTEAQLTFLHELESGPIRNHPAS